MEEIFIIIVFLISVVSLEFVLYAILSQFDFNLHKVAYNYGISKDSDEYGAYVRYCITHPLAYIIVAIVNLKE